VRLGGRGAVSRVEVDTRFFKGNAPESCSLEGLESPDAPVESVPDPGAAWKEILPRAPLEPDSVRVFQSELEDVGPITHARLNIFPDGGVARLRIRCRWLGSP
jgi:allantoicase